MDQPVPPCELTKEEQQAKPFEVFLSNEQHKLLQKILPVGFSLTLSDKNPRNTNKRGKNKPQ
jgi:hypothetical protein